MNHIRHGKKNVIGKQKISSKYHQLVKKCNSQNVSISCVVQKFKHVQTFELIENKNE